MSWDRDKKKYEDLAKSFLKDIAPVRGKIEEIKKGERDLDQLLEDSTFNAKLREELGHEPTKKEKKKIIESALDRI
ncbi:MAG: hypothetical protein BTN85_1002 [Candidatus Methanohalarchaeum thermophilum]|uniref:Uncharacterized protein n=1 Tax=Methanohalarchaeum thermophilum TaxID=1903181 RepID=A0A1Q6DVV4_METT1|nr:MAG: hypothetical protein BTN85_1002 [Candidatus Methanohalarchaeum thermophilum]